MENKLWGGKEVDTTGSYCYHPMVLNWRQFGPPGDILVMSVDIFGYQNYGRSSCYLHPVVIARDTAKHPTMHRTAHPLKELLAPNAKSAGVEKLCYNVL